MREQHRGKLFDDDDDLTAADMTDIAAMPGGVYADLARATGLRGLVAGPAGGPPNRFEIRGRVLYATDVRYVTRDGRAVAGDVEQVPVVPGGTVYVAGNFTDGVGELGVAGPGEPLPGGAEPLGVFDEVGGRPRFRLTAPAYRVDATPEIAAAWAEVRAAAEALLARAADTGRPAVAVLFGCVVRVVELGPSPTAAVAVAACRVLVRCASFVGVPVPVVEPSPEVSVPADRLAALLGDIKSLLQENSAMSNLFAEPAAATVPAAAPPPVPTAPRLWRRAAGVGLGITAVVAVGAVVWSHTANPVAQPADGTPAPVAVAVVAIEGKAEFVGVPGPLWPGQLSGVTVRMELAKPSDAAEARILWQLARPNGEVAAAGDVAKAGDLPAAVAKAVGGTGVPVSLKVAVGPSPAPQWSAGLAIGCPLPGGLVYPVPADAGGPAEDARDAAGQWYATAYRPADGARVSVTIGDDGQAFCVDQTVISVTQFLDRFAPHPKAAATREAAARLCGRFPVNLRTFDALSEPLERRQLSSPAELAAELGTPFLHNVKPYSGAEGYRAYPADPYLRNRFGVPLVVPAGGNTDHYPIVGADAYSAQAYVIWLREVTGDPRWRLAPGTAKWAGVLSEEAERIASPLPGPVPVSHGPRGRFGTLGAGGVVTEWTEPGKDGLAATVGRDWRGRAGEPCPALDRPPHTGFRIALEAGAVR